MKRWKTSLFGAEFLCTLLMIAPAKPGLAQVLETHKNCSTLSEPGSYPAYNPIPGYSIERRYLDASKPTCLVLRISVQTEAVNSGSLTRLACKLASDFPDETGMYALIFDDKKSAKSLSPGFTDQPNYWTYL